MNRSFARIGLLACFVLPLVACGQQGGSSGGSAAAVDDSPEYQAFQFRDGAMHALAWKVGKLRAMAQGEIPVDNAVALKNAKDTAALAGMIADGFIPNSIVKGSLALPEIWMNFSDFQQKANDLQMAATALADATQANGFEASKGMVQAVGQSCGGCHRPYRKRDEK
ncbi:MAG TPA: cytochrome c [Gammaproteobacteria bacterium]|nr:cytochrome c [Gammaproteobacteria bacterium]